MPGANVSSSIDTRYYRVTYGKSRYDTERYRMFGNETGKRDRSYVSSTACVNVNGGQQKSGLHDEALLLDMPRERCY